MGGLLRGWTLKIDLGAWTRSFRFKYAAGSNDIDKGKEKQLLLCQSERSKTQYHARKSIED